MNRVLDPKVQQGLAEATIAAPSVGGIEFKPDIAKMLPYPDKKMDELGLFSPDWAYVNKERPGWIEKMAQIFVVDRTGEMDIEVKNVAKRYGTSLAVSDVSFGVEQGHVLSLLGPSGCGKTTVMRMIAGLIQPSAGAIAIKGRPVNQIPVHKRNVGMLFQNYALFPHLTVAHNIAFGLEMRKLPKAEALKKAEAALAMVRLEGFGARYPHQLSGGQQQRVALARALVIEPAVLLLDEPFGALDKKLRENMQIEMRQLQQRLGITTLMVTHDQDEALTLSDRIAVMRAGGSSSSARRPRSTSGRCRASSRASSARRTSSAAASPGRHQWRLHGREPRTA